MPSNTSALFAVQQGFYTALSSDAQLTALASVFDTVPEPALYPYVVLGEFIETPDNQLGQFGSRVSMTLHTWSRYRGMAETNTLLAHLVRILDHQPVPVPGRTLIAIRLEQILTIRDSDPDIRHGVLRMTVETY